MTLKNNQMVINDSNFDSIFEIAHETDDKELMRYVDRYMNVTITESNNKVVIHCPFLLDRFKPDCKGRCPRA